MTTPDRITWDAGSVFIGDIKTGAHGPDSSFQQGGMARQLAAYNQAWKMRSDTGEWVDTPEANRRWGVIAHLDVQTSLTPCVRFFWCNLADGANGLHLTENVLAARKSRRTYSLIDV